MLPVAGGKSGLKPQGTVTHQKQWRADQKKYCLSYCNDKIILIKILLKIRISIDSSKCSQRFH